MIVICPACRTRYLVAEPELAASGGRTVRCANCAHTWRHEPAAGDRSPADPSAADQPSADQPLADRPLAERPLADRPLADRPEGGSSPAAAAPRLVSAQEALARPEPGRSPVAPRRRRRWIALGALVAVLLIVVAIVVLILGQGWVVAAWPSAGRVYDLVGLTAEAPGGGLQIGHITPSRTGDGLVIDGEIVNSGNIERTVPRLRVALQDAAGKEVQFQIVDPPKPLLKAGETAHFRTPFAHPGDSATGVVVTFAPG